MKKKIIIIAFMFGYNFNLKLILGHNTHTYFSLPKSAASIQKEQAFFNTYGFKGTIDKPCFSMPHVIFGKIH